MWFPGKAKRAEQRAHAARQAELVDGLRSVIGEPDRPEPARDASLLGDVRRAVFRGRRVLAPLVLLVVVWLLGARTSTTGTPPAAVVTLWAVVAGLWWVTRLRTRLDRAVERRYAWACFSVAGVWLAWTTVAGLDRTDFAGVLAWLAVSTPWWWHHWPSEHPATAVPESDTTSVPARWREHVAVGGGAAPGSVLFSPGFTRHGDSYRVQLLPGRQTVSQLVGEIPLVATALRTPMERIVIDACPETEDPSIARLQLIRRSPIKETVYFDCPRWDGGRVHLGPHADGLGEACWRVWSRNSMWGGFILGGIGSGKSRLLESIAVTVRAMSAVAGMRTMIVYLDGQDGASSAALWKHATVKGGPAQAEEILCALERALYTRQGWIVLHGLAGANAGVCPDGADEPLTAVLVIVDECHRIFTPDNADRWANLAREQRKGLMGIIGADQMNDLPVFGGSEALRSSLLHGNGVAMRTTSRTADGMFPGLELSTNEFPELAGYGYKVAAPGAGERTAPFRGRFLPDADDAADAAAAGRTLPVPTVDDWFAKYPEAPLDAMTARAFGSVYTDRAQHATRMLEAARDLVEGRALAVRPDASVAVQEDRRPAATPAKAGPATTRDLVLAALVEHGPRRPVELQEATGRSKTGVKAALASLREEGLIVPGPGQHQYAAVDPEGCDDADPFDAIAAWSS